MKPGRLATLLVFAAACGGTPSAKKAVTPVAANEPGATVEGGIRFVPCSVRPCVLHKGSGEHRECLNGDARACFLFGRVCQPTAKP